MNDCICESCLLSAPIGTIQIKGCSNGLHELNIKSIRKEVVENLKGDLIYKNDDAVLAFNQKYNVKCIQETILFLKEYFSANKIEELNTPSICWKDVCRKSAFKENVLKSLLYKTSFGERISYKELAVLSGHENAYRAVGSVMKNNPICILIPCHRVVKHDHKIGNYSSGIDVKQWLLELERKHSTKKQCSN